MLKSSWIFGFHRCPPIPGIPASMSPLPQIIVCGDQKSSGKSSVLEAISGVSHPVKNDHTDFQLEWFCGRIRKWSRVSIVPINPAATQSSIRSNTAL